MAVEAGVSLREILGIVESMAGQVRSIATASEEQSAASEKINHSIAEVNSISRKNSQTMNQAARAISSLSEQAQMLQKIIEDVQRETQGKFQLAHIVLGQ